jgi:tetratricopeptide (TPR) repeat protein
MYLSGSKWNMRRRRRRSRPWLVPILVLLIAAGVYFERVIVPSVPPLFVPTLTPTRSPATYVLQAESLFAAGKLDQAEEAYRQAITIDPQQAAFYVALARTQVFNNMPEDAARSAEDALLIDPNSAQAHAVYAWALDFQGGEANLTKALEEINKALQIDPNSALSLAYQAEILMDNSPENYKEALDAAQRAVQIDPNLLEGHRALGYVWESTANYQNAMDSYETALRINPNLAILHVSMGNMLLNQGDTNGAISSYLQASQLMPTSVQPLQLIAQAYARVGDFGKASQYAETAVGLKPADPRLHGDLGRMYYKNNDLDQAVIELELAVRGGTTEQGIVVQAVPWDAARSSTVEFYWTYGLALAKTGQCGQAVEIFQALLAEVRDDTVAVENVTQGMVLCGVLQPTATPRSGETPAP